jgi:hypothetical protein
MPKKPILSAEMLRVAGNGQEGLRGGPEEDAVNHFFVVKGDSGQLFRDGEHDMEISDRQQFGLPVFEPLCTLRVLALRAMSVAAGVIGYARVVALAAFFGMTAEHGGTADLDCPHHT